VSQSWTPFRSCFSSAVFTRFSNLAAACFLGFLLFATGLINSIWFRYHDGTCLRSFLMVARRPGLASLSGFLGDGARYRLFELETFSSPLSRCLLFVLTLGLPFPCPHQVSGFPYGVDILLIPLEAGRNGLVCAGLWLLPLATLSCRLLAGGYLFDFVVCPSKALFFMDLTGRR